MSSVEEITAEPAVLVRPDQPVKVAAGAKPLATARIGAPTIDYLEPAGDPGFFGPDSMAWRVHANPIALAVGGVAAVILELAEPRVRTGVWEHSIFRTDPLTRMQRTGDATMITTYGPTKAAEARVAMVSRMHGRVSGRTPEGQAYGAMDPELLTWVHVTASFGFLNAYRRYVDPALSLADQDRYYAEGGRLGRAFGAADVPASVSEINAYMETWRDKLVPHAIIGEFLQIVSTTSPLGLAGRLVQPLAVEGSISILPDWAPDQLKLPRRPMLHAAAQPTLKALAATAGLKLGEIPRLAYKRVGRSPP